MWKQGRHLPLFGKILILGHRDGGRGARVLSPHKEGRKRAVFIPLFGDIFSKAASCSWNSHDPPPIMNVETEPLFCRSRRNFVSFYKLREKKLYFPPRNKCRYEVVFIPIWRWHFSKNLSGGRSGREESPPKSNRQRRRKQPLSCIRCRCRKRSQRLIWERL